MGKRVQKVSLNNLSSKTLDLGYMGEHEHTRIEIDCTEVLWDYPNATASMVVQPPTGDMYPLTPTREEDTIVWLVTDSDVANHGTGSVQITFTNNGEIVKSAIGTTRVRQSIVATGEAPDPIQTWIDQAEETAAEIAAEAAAGVVDDLAEAKDAAIEAIEAKGEETIESIPEDYTNLSNQVTDLKSAKAPSIFESASGAIASFADGADGMPLKALSVEIDPVQDLHGYDNPWPAGGGVNKLLIDSSAFPSNRWISYDSATEKISIVQGSGSAPSPVEIINTIPSGTTITVSVYVESGQFTSGTIAVGGYTNANPAWQGQISFPLSTNLAGKTYKVTTTTTDVLDRFELFVYGNPTITTSIVFKAQIEIGENNNPSWHPYSNICPITGHSSVTVTRTGVNLWGGEKMANDIVAAVNNANYAYKGSDSTGSYLVLAGSTYLNVDRILYGCFKENTQYSIIIKAKKNNTNRSTNLYVVYTDGTSESVGLQSSGSVEQDTIYLNAFATASGKTVSSITTSYASGTATIYYDNFGVFEGVITADQFEPYQGISVQIPLGQTVYGGTLDVTEGKLIVDRVSYTIDETKDIKFATNSSGFLFYFSSELSLKNNNIQITNQLKYEESGTASSLYANVNRFIAYQNGTLYFKFSSDLDTVADVKAYLANNPIQTVLPLNTPLEYTLTEQEMTTLLGQNNIFADSGDVSVEYPADTKLYIDRKITEAIAAALNA